MSFSFRSPLLMNRSDTALVIIDVQEKLLPHVFEHERVSWNISRLIRGAGILGVEVGGSEQYPQGLGRTIDLILGPLKSLSRQAIGEKTMFSCRECESIFSAFSERGIHNLLLCGIETHVCVAQTALDLLSHGFNVFVSIDAVGTRFPIDHETALRRMENSGVTLTTTEAALFEWCEKSGSDEFKQISKLVREPPSSRCEKNSRG